MAAVSPKRSILRMLKVLHLWWMARNWSACIKGASKKEADFPNVQIISLLHLQHWDCSRRWSLTLTKAAFENLNWPPRIKRKTIILDNSFRLTNISLSGTFLKIRKTQETSQDCLFSRWAICRIENDIMIFGWFYQRLLDICTSIL